MKKTTIAAMALALPALGAMAIVPKEETPVLGQHDAVFSKQLVGQFKQAAKASSDNRNSFFEGFEGRDPSAYGNVANRWLPAGWTEFSRKDNAHVGNDEAKWDLTWLTLSNETVGHLPSQFKNSAYEGDCFAYIMCDVMWGGKEGPNLEQDEWLVTPAVTPKPEEWFYFKLQYSPGWCLYNRDANDFSGANNLLEVYITEGDGTTDSEWKCLWNLKDMIASKYTDSDLRANLTGGLSTGYESVYINVADYVGKEVKLAFRYFGLNGHGMALDNVSLGIPQPKPYYNLPNGFFKQQSLTPTMQEIAGDFSLLIPYGAEAEWIDESEDVLSTEWSFADAAGAMTTSEQLNLITPEYTLGQTYPTPVLTGKFESRTATYQSPYTMMQAGGRLYGKGKDGYEGPLGIGYYDYLDPMGTLAQSTDYISLSSTLNDSWELLLGRMPNTIDVLGIGCLYLAPDVPYGFDYIDINAMIVGDGTLSDEASFVVNVFRLPDDAYTETATVIGQALLTGAEINEMPIVERGSNGYYKNLRFTLDVPVTTDSDILVLVSPYTLGEDDHIVLPFMKSTDNKVVGNSVVYMMVYDSEENGGTYDTFYNLNAFPMSTGHFAGLLMTLGASYSYMEAVDGETENVVIPREGGTHTVNIRAMHSPDTWAVTDDGILKSQWISHEAYAVDPDGDIYETTLTFEPNDAVEPREADVYVAQAGSRVKLHVVQAGLSQGISSAAAGTARVSTQGDDIVVDGAQGTAEVFNAAGYKVAEAAVNGHTVIPAAHLAKGVYIVRVGEITAKIVK